MFTRLLRVFVTALSVFLVLGLCATTAEAKSVARVTGVKRAGQDWQHAKLKIRWNPVTGATKYRMRVSGAPARLRNARPITARVASGTFTRKLVRNRSYYVQVRAVRKGTLGRWSRVARIKPVRRVSAPVHTAPNPPSASGGTRFGFWAGNDVVGGNAGARANFDRVKSYLGAPDVYRMFYPGDPGTNFSSSNADFGPPVVVSFKLRPTDVTAGKWDARMRTWFNSIPNTRQVWWSYFHEPENDIEHGAFTAAQYRAAWKHLTNLAPERGNLHPTLTLMRYTLSIPTKRTVADYVTSGLEVLAWDSYLTGNLGIKAVVDDPAAVSRRFGLGFAIGEVSAKDPSKMDKFVRDFIPAAKRNKAEFVTWFETNKKGGGANEADWRMRPHSGAVAAWRQ